MPPPPTSPAASRRSRACLPISRPVRSGSASCSGCRYAPRRSKDRRAALDSRRLPGRCPVPRRTVPPGRRSDPQSPRLRRRSGDGCSRHAPGQRIPSRSPRRVVSPCTETSPAGPAASQLPSVGGSWRRIQARPRHAPRFGLAAPERTSSRHEAARGPRCRRVHSRANRPSGPALHYFSVPRSNLLHAAEPSPRCSGSRCESVLCVGLHQLPPVCLTERRTA